MCQNFQSKTLAKFREIEKKIKRELRDSQTNGPTNRGVYCIVA